MSVTPYNQLKFRLAPEGAYYEFKQQTGVKTTKQDRRRPQVYVVQDGKVLSWKKWTQGGHDFNPKNPTSRSLHSFMPFSSTKAQPIRNKAYERMREYIAGDSAALGTALAETEASFGMIQKRAMGLYRAYKALRKGDFRKFLKELSVSPKRKHKNLIRNGAHEASGLWLEYWFGWSPAINDIYTAVDQLSQPAPHRFQARGRASTPVLEKSTTQEVSGKYSAQTQCWVELIDPNQFLLSQLGMTNPFTVAWEIVPFSFLADWCFDVSSFIGSYTDFAGLKLSEKATTEMLKCDWIVRPSSGNQTGQYKASQLFMERRLELIRPLPNLEILRNLGVSKTRAASAVALLTQILRV